MKQDGTLWAKGDNLYGQSGDGSTAPVASGVGAIAAGLYHSLYLKQDGTLWAMGSNGAGQLGIGGSTSGPYAPTQVTTGVASISAGWLHSLFVKKDGTLWAMGLNDSGQIGDGTFDYSRRVPVSVAAGVSTVATGVEHSLFLKTDGTLWAMGQNSDGQLGDGTLTSRNLPVQVAVGVKAIAAGNSESWYVKTDGTLWAVGGRHNAKSADGSTLLPVAAVQIATGVSAIAQGTAHALYVTSDGTLWSVGQNLAGQLGRPTMFSRSLPVLVADDVGAVSAGRDYAMYLKADNKLWAVGQNSSAQFGDGTYTSRNISVEVDGGVREMAAGVFHSLRVKNDGTLWAAGSNHYGQIGDGTTERRKSPVQVASGVAVIAAGYEHSLYLNTDGTLRAMGGNTYGELGDGTTTHRQLPVAVAGGVTAVSAGYQHSLFVKLDGSLWGMGRSLSGQLGVGNGLRETTPVAVASGVRSVAAGRDHSYYVKTDGTLWAMGFNSYGQLGDGTTTTRPAPVQVATGVKAVWAGDYHGVFLKTDDTLWSMGANQSGQLGDGSLSQQNSPVLVAGGVTAASSGDSVSYFIQPPGIGTIPSVIAQPVGGSYPAGTPLTLSVAVTGSGPFDYRWRKDGLEIPRILSADLQIVCLQASDAGTYSVVVKNGVGSVTSSSATVAVTSVDVAPVLISQPAMQMLKAGATARFLAEATGAPAPVYQWQRQSSGTGSFVDLPNGGAYAGTTTSVLTVSPATAAMHNDRFRCVITNGVGSPVVTTAAPLTVNTPPKITSANTATFAAGQPGAFTLTATGNPQPSFALTGGTLPSWASLDAATGVVSGTPTATIGSPFTFTLSATNGIAPDATQSFTLSVVPLPISPAITTQPVSFVVSVGSPVMLAVAATGVPPPTYQWKKDNVSLGGEAAASLTRASAQLADAGSYTVVVSNSAGQVTSSPAVLTVVPAGAGASHSITRGGYTGGGTVTLFAVLNYPIGTAGAGWQLRLPEGWSFAAYSGPAATTTPTPGATNLVEWMWSTPPTSPLLFSYTLNVPAAATGDIALTAKANLLVSGFTVHLAVQPDPIVVRSAVGKHSADADGDGTINLAELTRVLELYNTRTGTVRTGRYVVSASSVDGFAPDPSVTAGPIPATPHTADLNRDGRLSLPELTRVIELFNTRSGSTRTGAYHAAATPTATEDGFAPGP
jgi:alpha-tubulin suppressor-like RCC1 family protein